MPITIEYTSRCPDGYDLASGHLNGVTYNLNSHYSTFIENAPRSIRKDKTALTGRKVSTYHRVERTFTVTIDRVPLADLPFWREFRGSTKYGADSEFSIDASAVPHIGYEHTNCVMDGALSITQEGRTDFFTIEFKYYMQPGGFA